MFFSFDGIDGGGKSTQIDLFCEWLSAQGHSIVTCRDPGSTALGEQIRDLLLSHGDTRIDRTCEMLLYMSARAQMVDEIIRPALAAGKTIVSDRFLLANVVYQGHAGGLVPEDIWRVGEIATAGVAPDMTFVLDMDPEVAAKRFRREFDRMEANGLAFQRAVRQGFLTEASREKNADGSSPAAARCRGRIVVVDAAREVEAVQADIRRAAQEVLAK